jgi:hypothetical protein
MGTHIRGLLFWWCKLLHFELKTFFIMSATVKPVTLKDIGLWVACSNSRPFDYYFDRAFK